MKVLVLGAQAPGPLLGEGHGLPAGPQIQHPGGVPEAHPVVGGLHAGPDLLAHRLQEHVDEEAVDLCRGVGLRLEYPVVGAFHQALLQA